MKFSYAFRRGAYHPFVGDDRELPDPVHLPKYLSKLRSIGFEGIEILLKYFDPVSENALAIDSLCEALDASSMPCVVVNAGGGSMSDLRVSTDNKNMIERAITLAKYVGAGLVNVPLVSPPVDPKGPGATFGESISQGSSRLASDDVFKQEAAGLSYLAGIAEPYGISLTIEIHQRSIADNSWSSIRLLNLVDGSNIGINPDLGNIQQAYDVPEESYESAITAVAPYSNYWHCKNASVIPLPDLRRTANIRVPLPDGDIDYRFAMTAMLKAGFDGYMAVEGSGVGDALTKDARSLYYIKGLYDELNKELG